MVWHPCSIKGHKHRTQDAATNCHYCRMTHRRFMEGMKNNRVLKTMQKTKDTIIGSPKYCSKFIDRAVKKQ